MNTPILVVGDQDSKGTDTRQGRDDQGSLGQSLPAYLIQERLGTRPRPGHSPLINSSHPAAWSGIAAGSVGAERGGAAWWEGSRRSPGRSAGDTVAGPRRDVIRNFEPGPSLDVIDLSAMDANVRVPGDQAFTFVAATRHPGTGQVGYHASGRDTVVVGNDGAATFEILLRDFRSPLHATDFRP